MLSDTMSRAPEPLWADPPPDLSEKDHLAMLLAHAWVRASNGTPPKMGLVDFPLGMATDALDLGGGYCDDLRDAVVYCSQWSNRKRIVRARLAMFLRAWYRLEMGGDEPGANCHPLWTAAKRHVE